MLSGFLTTLGMSASPLSEARQSSLNSTMASEPAYNDDYHVEVYTDTQENHSNSPPSSPFVANLSDPMEDSENISPRKIRTMTTSPIDRESTSSLKMLKSRTSPTLKSQSPQKSPERASSPRKLSSPEKRFPVKPSSPRVPSRPVEINIEDVLRENEGLTKAIEILEDENSFSNQKHISESTGDSIAGDQHVGGLSMDDTVMSTFSDFSILPDLTTFAKLGQSPTKFSGIDQTPRRTQMTPSTARRPMNRSPSPTPRGHTYRKSREEGNTTNLILDFTEQMNGFGGCSHPSPARQARHSPLKGNSVADMSWASTPSVKRNSNMSNLLDFDIPPAPTPRSMPSITPRELESLKSGFLSEISSLKACLSGKEAEVLSLKTAVGDAEKRVGESLEQVREEKNLKEQLAAEKEEWEKRGREMEAVLRNVREEIVHGERERDELEGRCEESERRREAAEMMAQEAESKMAAMKAGKGTKESEEKFGECSCGGRAVDLAVEKVSRELHTLYKEKHETKVAALKKSYEKRWDKKIRELEDQIAELQKENEEFKLGRDTTLTKVEPRNTHEVTQDLEKQAAQDAKIKEMEAELEGLSEVIKSVKQDNTELRNILDEERVEKGKLVAAVDEMIPLVAAFDDMLVKMDSEPIIQSPTKSQTQSQNTSVENLRGSISRASGLRAPTSVSSITSGESRIGRGGFGVPAGHERNKSGGSQGTRPGSGLGYRSGIMSSIERMGSHKGRGD